MAPILCGPQQAGLRYSQGRSGLVTDILKLGARSKGRDISRATQPCEIGNVDSVRKRKFITVDLTMLAALHGDLVRLAR